MHPHGFGRFGSGGLQRRKKTDDDTDQEYRQGRNSETSQIDLGFHDFEGHAAVGEAFHAVIESGNFLKTGLLHNSYTAGKEGVESTGNAARSSYVSIPSIGITNFIMKPGDIPAEEIIKDIKKGIILNYTGDSPNISTGDFSGLILHGNLIKNGEIKESLNETMIGINLLDLFQNIDSVSKEYTIYGAFQAPWVRINSVNIIGGAD